jgi:acyl-coenzyme A thioesterase PaaI-like protein
MSEADPGRYLNIPDEVDPDWTARRRLSRALTRLTEACVAGDLDGVSLDTAAAAVEALADGLGTQTRTARDAFADGSYHDQPAHWIDRSALVGRCNPIAPPMMFRFEDGRSHATFTLGHRHGGAPGIAHGGIVAAAFDQAMGHCATMHGVGGLTTTLTIRFKKPTPLCEPLRIEAWRTQQVGPFATFEAASYSADRCLGTATGVFKVLDAAHAAHLFSGR